MRVAGLLAGLCFGTALAMGVMEEWLTMNVALMLAVIIVVWIVAHLLDKENKTNE